MNIRDRIMVALDFPTLEQARRCVAALQGKASYLKVGMELFYHAGPSFIGELKELGFKVFVDLKLHDIPNTVKGAARSLTRLGVDMINVHASGGIEMMRAAREGIEEGLNSGQNPPILIGVTILTSTDQQIMNEEMNISGTIEAQVLHLSRLCKDAGLNGVVASPLEVVPIKKNLGSSFITVTPGIRPSKVNAHDQKRVATPEEAFRMGTDYMVIGRAITMSDNPGEAFEMIVKSLEKIESREMDKWN